MKFKENGDGVEVYLRKKGGRSIYKEMQQEGKYNTKDVWKNYKELYCFYFTQIYIYTLNKVKQPGLTILPTLRDLDCLIKTLGPSMRNFLLNY